MNSYSAFDVESTDFYCNLSADKPCAGYMPIDTGNFPSTCGTNNLSWDIEV